MLRFALACGRLDVDEFIGNLSQEQWAEWVAFDHLEPVGEKRGDLRNAMLVAHILRMLAAMAGGEPDAIEERHFLPYLHELHEVDRSGEPAQDPRLTRLALKMLCARAAAQH